MDVSIQKKIATLCMEAQSKRSSHAPQGDAYQAILCALQDLRQDVKEDVKTIRTDFKNFVTQVTTEVKDLKEEVKKTKDDVKKIKDDVKKIIEQLDHGGVVLSLPNSVYCGA